MGYGEVIGACWGFEAAPRHAASAPSRRGPGVGTTCIVLSELQHRTPIPSPLLRCALPFCPALLRPAAACHPYRCVFPEGLLAAHCLQPPAISPPSPELLQLSCRSRLPCVEQLPRQNGSEQHE